MKKYFKSFFALGIGAALLLGTSAAFAQSPTATTTPRFGRGANAVTNMKASANKQITARVDSLNMLLTRIEAMIHLTTDEKSSISTTVSSDISSLGALQAKIDADATTTLKADVQSITKGERIYLLVEPQTMILAVADRAASIGDALTAFVGKIQTRLAAMPDAAASSLLTDLQAKVTDAQTQAAAAISETAALVPDNGDASIQASNTAALKDARSKIKTAQQDLKAAYQDAVQIVNAIRSMHMTASTTPMTTTSSGY